MSPQKLIEMALDQTIDQIPDSPTRRRVSGKVRDMFELPGDRLALVTTDRISVFDYVIGSIPFKGQVLNQLAGWWLRKLDDIGIPHHLLSLPHPNVSVVRRATPLPIEIVVRGYLTGSTKTSSWYAYQNLDRVISGIIMPEGMKKNEPFAAPIITPSTKPDVGHDENISRDDILARGLTTPAVLAAAEDYALRMFAHGQKLAAARGLILVDTKYEMGVTADQELIVIDEVHTPDSSRYWLRETYDDRVANGLEPESLDKEFVRRMIVDNGYDITSSVHPKTFLTDDIRIEAARRYLRLFEAITGTAIEPRLASVDEIVALLDRECVTAGAK
jgi:phosphoribosylaminoimidazole-succinocarboxamide synthase